MKMFAKNIFAMEEDGEREEGGEQVQESCKFFSSSPAERRAMQTAFHNLEILGLHG